MSGSLRRNEEPRETLHDYSIDYVKAIAEVFGWKVRAFKGPQKGPDLIVEEHGKDTEGRERVGAVMFVESEVGHDESEGVGKYYEKISKKLRPHIDEYRAKGVKDFSLVVITNTLRKHVNYVKRYGQKLSEKMGFQVIEGFTLFVVPALLVKEVIPAIFVRAMRAPATLLSSRVHNH